MNESMMERIKLFQSQNHIFHPLTCGIDSKHQHLAPKLKNNEVILHCLDCSYEQSYIPIFLQSESFFNNHEVITQTLTSTELKEQKYNPFDIKKYICIHSAPSPLAWYSKYVGQICPVVDTYEETGFVKIIVFGKDLNAVEESDFLIFGWIHQESIEDYNPTNE